MPLPKINRLSLRFHQDDFKSGQKFYSKHFTIIVGARPDAFPSVIPGTDPESIKINTLSTTDHRPSTQPVFSILVSKKTAKKAHDRNRIRRLTSSAIQNLLPQFPIGQYLILPKSTFPTSPFSEILTDLSSLLPKLQNNTLLTDI